MRGVACSDEHTENYQLNLQLSSPLRSFIVSFSPLLICPATTLLFWFTLIPLIVLFEPQQAAVLGEKAVKSHCTLPALQRKADGHC